MLDQFSRTQEWAASELVYDLKEILQNINDFLVLVRSMPPTPSDIHELIDVISAIQHVIIDPLNDLTRDEIVGLTQVAQLNQALQNTIHLLSVVDEYNGNNSTGGGMNRAVWPSSYGVKNWGAGRDPRIQDMSAISFNAALGLIPGIKRSTIEGLINGSALVVSDDEDENVEPVNDLSMDIMAKLKSFLPALRRLDSMGLPRHIKGLITLLGRSLCRHHQYPS